MDTVLQLQLDSFKCFLLGTGMTLIKRSHKLSPSERRQKIAGVIIPEGWYKAGSHVLLTKEQILKIFGFSDGTFSAVCSVTTDPFPKPFLYITPRQPRWLGKEVYAWLMLMRERRDALARLALPATAFKVSQGGDDGDGF